jgi:hypothetical protein
VERGLSGPPALSNPYKRLDLVGDVAAIEWLHPEVRNGQWLDTMLVQGGRLGIMTPMYFALARFPG